MNNILQSENGQLKLYSAIDSKWFSIIDKSASFHKDLNENATQHPFYNNRIIHEKDSTKPIHSKGQVGYGVLYDSSFKTNFETGAIIEHLIICPDKAGGDLNDFLYLTSTNRTAKGVEAFLCYLKQNEFCFKVFDWAQKDHWQISIDRNKLSDYLTTKSVNGNSFQVIHVINLTYQTSKDKWINDVYLKNIRTNQLDVIYRYEYTSTLTEQKDPSVGFWAPIIETFQSNHNKLNLIGFIDTHVSSRDKNGKWNGWQNLEKTISSVRNDGVGFNVAYLLPNYTFIC